MELASRIADEFSIRGLKLRRSPDIDARCIDSAGKPLWVIHNPVTGRYFHASRELYLAISRLNGRKPIEEILTEYAEHSRTSEDELRDVALGLRAAFSGGILQSEHARAKPPTPNS